MYKGDPNLGMPTLEPRIHHTRPAARWRATSPVRGGREVVRRSFDDVVRRRIESAREPGGHQLSKASDEHRGRK